MALAQRYFTALCTYLRTMIQVEYVYVECLNEKLKRLTEAHNEVFEHMDAWSMDKVKSFVIETVITATRMKIAQATIQKKRSLENVKQEIAALQREYEASKQRLAAPQLDAQQVRMEVMGFFHSVTQNFNNSADNLVLTTWLRALEANDGRETVKGVYKLIEA